MTTLTKGHNNHQAHSPLTSRRLHQMRDILSEAESLLISEPRARIEATGISIKGINDEA